MKRDSVSLVIIFLMFAVFCFPVQAQVSFFQPPIYSGSGSVFVADFNGDGKPDILTSDGTMNLGNGDGTFKPGTALTGSTLPVLAVADFNGDGKPDVLEQGTGTLLVLLGKGDGTFQAAITTASGASLSFVAAGDLNGDGNADVVGVFNGSLLVYVSNGDGTLKAGVPYTIGSAAAPGALTLGDFNGDKHTDVAISTAGGNLAGQEIVFLGKGDGTFATPPKTSVGITGLYSATDAIAADFSGDGKLDLAISGDGTTCFNTGVCPTYVQLGNGDGTFQAPAVAFNVVGSMAAGDVNGDGRADLVVVTCQNPVTSQVYLANADGSFTNFSNYGISVGSLGIGTSALADFNGDGKLDIAAGAILLGNGDGTFHGIQLGVAADGGVPQADAVGDFEKKGALDVAMLTGTQSPANTISILSNNGAGVLSLLHTYTLPQAATALFTGDFNGDGNLDLLTLDLPPNNATTWSYSILLGNGDGSFQSPVSYAESGSPTSFAVADFNNDKKLDFAVGFPAGSSGSTASSLGVFLGNGDGTFAAPVYYYDAGGSPLLVADFNGDGKPDISVAVGSAGDTGILYGNGDGTFQAEVFPSSLKVFQPAFVADFNNDGKPDFLSAFTDQVALGNGDGTFTVLNPFYNSNGGPFGYEVIAIADFNGDGNQDLLIDIGPASGTGIMLGNGDGTFAPFVNILSANDGGTLYNSPVVPADMNGDGIPDIVFPWADNTTSGIKGVPFPSGAAELLSSAPPDFTINPASGSSSSQTISAGESAKFSVLITPSGSLTGMVNLTCSVSPTVGQPPSCSLSSSSVTISGTTAQAVTVTVGTVPVTATALPHIEIPPGAMPMAWILMLLGFGWRLLGCRKRLHERYPQALYGWAVLCLFSFGITMSACGGSNGSGGTGGTGGTPAGTYTVTVTANLTSGSTTLTHTTKLTVVVQ